MIETSYSNVWTASSQAFSASLSSSFQASSWKIFCRKASVLCVQLIINNTCRKLLHKIKASSLGADTGQHQPHLGRLAFHRDTLIATYESFITVEVESLSWRAVYFFQYLPWYRIFHRLIEFALYFNDFDTISVAPTIDWIRSPCDYDYSDSDTRSCWAWAASP